MCCSCACFSCYSAALTVWDVMSCSLILQHGHSHMGGDCLVIVHQMSPQCGCYYITVSATVAYIFYLCLNLIALVVGWACLQWLMKCVLSGMSAWHDAWQLMCTCTQRHGKLWSSWDIMVPAVNSWWNSRSVVIVVYYWLHLVFYEGL